MIKINPRKILGQPASESATVASISESQEDISEAKPARSETCSAPCGMNYCDDNGCQNRSRTLVTPSPLPEQETPGNENKSDLLAGLWEEFGKIKRERGKLSSRTAYLVVEQGEQLKLQSSDLHELFMKGEYCSEELRDHYAAIQKLIDSGASVYDSIQHVQQHGVLPSIDNGQVIESDQEKILYREIRRLDDLIYKTSKKLEHKPLSGKKSSKAAEWKEKIALASAKRDDLKQKLKRLQHEARAKRSGTQ